MKEHNKLLSSEALKKVRQIEIRTKRLLDSTLAGRYQSVFKGQGINFEEVREYIAGDDIRTIDWNVTARTGMPHIKKFTEERELSLMLLIDISASGDFGSVHLAKREFMAELGAILAFSAIHNKDKVGLALFTDDVELYIPPGKGRRHILRIIREILYFQPQGKTTNIQNALDFIGRITKERCVTFLLSDFLLPDDFAIHLAALRPQLQITSRRHDLISLVISDPREYTLPDVGWITLEDAETGEQTELDTSNIEVRKKFAAQAMERKKLLLKTLRAAGSDTLDLATDTNWLPPLVQFFKNRQRRRV